ncbi:MAG: RidA family protein [Dehalococcoidia bacterium]
MSAEDRIEELGIELPPPPSPAGLYSPCVETGNLLFVSGQIPSGPDGPLRTGHCGTDVSVDEASELARVCGINALAAVRAHLGTLDRVARVVRVGGFVASSPAFVEHPKVVNGASQLMLDVFGEAGRHARAAVGMAALPAGVPVEVEFLFEILPAEAE